MNKLLGIIIRATFVAVISFGFVTSVKAAATYWESPYETTNSWFDTTYWRSGVLPTPLDDAYFGGGVCSLGANTNVIVTKLSNYGSYSMGTLDIESGSSLTVSNYCIIGLFNASATVNVRGELNVVNSFNNGFVLGGYRVGLTNNIAILNIDGGRVNYIDKNNDWHPFQIGGASTGIVEISNGGQLYTGNRVDIAKGTEIQSDGTLIINDGTWTNAENCIVGNSYGNGRFIINSGGYYSTSTSSDQSMVIGSSGGKGYFEINDGEFITKHPFSSESPADKRNMILVGNGSTNENYYIQNGGYVETVGLFAGAAFGSSGTAIISNGVFKAMSNGNQSDYLQIFDKFILAGGEFIAYTNDPFSADNPSIQLYGGGVIEFSGGKFTSRDVHTLLYTYSNSTIRIIGPKCDIDIGRWRHDSPDSGNGALHTTMELILTQDPGHLSTLKSPIANNYTALPGIMDVGFAGGACLLATNQLTCMYAGLYFYTSLVDPANYGLDLWDVAKFDVATGGDNMNLTLKAGASLGTVSLPSVTYASFAPQAYGYVNVENLDLGTLPELSVMMTMTAGAKTLDQVVTDLQTAGYTNSVKIDGQTVAMKIPAEEITVDDGYLGWDFREFDGTVNATVSALAFQFSPQGSVFIIQ